MILSNNRRNFISEIVKILYKKFLIKYIFSSPYYPQTNGIVERLNWILCSSLTKVKKKDKNCNIYILAILFAYRTKRHTTIRYTPF